MRESSGARRGFVVLNPTAGDGRPQRIKEILQETPGAGQYDLYETTGEDGESVRRVVETAVRQTPYAWVAAIGGDGTVSEVVDGLVGADVPLAIIPAGTGNALAQELGIPREAAAACRQLLTGAAGVRRIDAIRVGDQFFVLQMGAGVEAVTLTRTGKAEKKRWGVLAYVWTAVKTAFGWQPYRFTLTIDGREHPLYATELIIANASRIGLLDLDWREGTAPDDGEIDVAVIRARSLADYARITWAFVRRRPHESRHVRYFTAREAIELAAERPLPLHGDGEPLEANWPLTAHVVPGALPVLVPSRTPTT